MKIRTTYWIWHALLWSLFLVACNTHTQSTEPMYTCPMPQDSVFSNKPGKCPKCNMDLVLMQPQGQHDHKDPDKSTSDATSHFTCPMHPQISQTDTGVCPICGMELVKAGSPKEPFAVSLNTLLKPANNQVIASIPMLHMMQREEDIEMPVLGFTAYDTRQIGSIASNYAGRIEKLYVRYRYQKIYKGQKIMEIYSPELLTAQENLLFLLKNDPENGMLINAAKQKLSLLGLHATQLDELIKSGKPSYRITVYSNYSGHVHESVLGSGMNTANAPEANNTALITQELSIKEGMYLQKGQNVFSVFNPDKAWILLQIYSEQVPLVKVGNKVRIVPETNPEKDFRATIDYIEPFYREGSKTATVRVYFDNTMRKLPMGSQVKATLFAGNRFANWLPEEAVLSMGLDKVVFVRTGESFTARKIETGIIHKHLIQVLGGLASTEAVAANAQYLVDSESFIKTDN